jgi:hypothetical protein
MPLLCCVHSLTWLLLIGFKKQQHSLFEKREKRKEKREKKLRRPY